MKTRFLILSLAALATGRAADTQTIDLENGTSIEVKDGKVTVKAKASGGGNQSASSSVKSSSNGDGSTTSTVTSERNGQKVTRTVTIDKNGKVTVADPAQPGKPGEPVARPAGADGAWMGVHTAPVPEAVRGQVDIPEGQGVVVEFTAPAGPAAAAGLAANDILLKLNGEPLAGVEALRQKLAALKAGTKAEVEYMRKGKTATASVTLSQRPPEAPADDKVTDETRRLLHEMENKKGNTRRTVVVGPDGKTTVTESSSQSGGSSGGSSDAFDALLKDPNIPEEMKEQLRRTQAEMKKLQESAKP